MGKHTGILAVDGVRKQGYISGNRQSALRNTSTEATRGEIVSTALAVAPPHTLRFSFKASVKTFKLRTLLWQNLLLMPLINEELQW